MECVLQFAQLAHLLVNNSLVKPDEEVCDLQCEGLVCLQKKSGYKLTTDSVLLANFVEKEQTPPVVVEFCAGSGVISILLSAKINPKKIYAVEIQKKLADMCARSVKLNGLKNVCVESSSFQDFALKGGVMPSIIVANPPYFRAEDGRLPTSEEIKKSRFEMDMTISSLITSAKQLLKNGGLLYLVHITKRKAEIEKELNKQGFYIKRLCYCFAKKGKPSHIFLLEAVLGQKCATQILEPIILNNEDGTETEQLKAIYNRSGAKKSGK